MNERGEKEGGELSPYGESFYQICERLRSLSSDRNKLFEEAKAMHKTLEVPKPTSKQAKFAFIPTDMGRISPFFPLNRRDQAKTRPMQSFSSKTPWGEIMYEGPLLCTHDEDVLLAITYLLKKQKTFVIETSINEICGILGVNKGRNTHQAIWNSLKHLARGTFIISVKNKAEAISHTISSAKRDLRTGKVMINVDAFFAATFFDGLVSTIDLQFRRSLKGSITKLLYRFLECHPGREHMFHFLTVAGSLNLNLQKEHFRIRDDLKRAFRELKAKGFLESVTLKGDVFLIKKKGGLVKSKKERK